MQQIRQFEFNELMLYWKGTNYIAKYIFNETNKINQSLVNSLLLILKARKKRKRKEKTWNVI